eukprot:6499161-Heterocapsa_arctica.AAC.1
MGPEDRGAGEPGLAAIRPEHEGQGQVSYIFSIEQKSADSRQNFKLSENRYKNARDQIYHP